MTEKIKTRPWALPMMTTKFSIDRLVMAINHRLKKSKCFAKNLPSLKQKTDQKLSLALKKKMKRLINRLCNGDWVFNRIWLSKAKVLMKIINVAAC